MGKRSANTGTGGGVVVPIRARKYTYAVMLATAPLAIAYGIVDSTQAGLWVSLAGAVLGVSNALALVNVPQVESSPQDEPV